MVVSLTKILYVIDIFWSLTTLNEIKVDLISGFAKFVPLQINQDKTRKSEKSVIQIRFLPADLIP